MEAFKENQLDIMLYVCGICTALMILAFISKAIPKKRRVALILMELSSFSLLFFDRLAYIYRGNISDLGYIMVRVSNYMVYALSLFVIYTYNLIIKDSISKIRDSKKYILIIIKAVDFLIIVGEILIVVSQFTGMYYTFDEFNRYQRGKFFVISYISPLISLILLQLVVQANRKNISRLMRIPLELFSIIPLVATIAQIFLYGLSLTNISIVGIAMLLYIFSLIDINEMVRKANENEIRLLKEEQDLLSSMFEETASALASAIDAKDEYTHGHSRRVARYSELIAKRAGLEDADCKKVLYSLAS